LVWSTEFLEEELHSHGEFGHISIATLLLFCPMQLFLLAWNLGVIEGGGVHDPVELQVQVQVRVQVRHQRSLSLLRRTMVEGRKMDLLQSCCASPHAQNQFSIGFLDVRYRSA